MYVGVGRTTFGNVVAYVADSTESESDTLSAVSVSAVTFDNWYSPILGGSLLLIP